ncbi:hypothetical protein HYN24_09130 [Dechloromonas sp. HYN0024]|nr:hypothetical protein HYN24_09130 [Dechloromonas sp. HYN0024]
MIQKATKLLREYRKWLVQLPQATNFLFAARTPLGRSAKIFLFGVGVILPLGSLIWVALYLHGNGILASERLVKPN